MTDIEKLNKEYQKLRKEQQDKLGGVAEYKLENLLKEFYFEIREIKNELPKFGNDFEIIFPIIGGRGIEENFKLIFSPWNIDEKILKGSYESLLLKDNNKLYFTFYPDFDIESEAFNLDEGKGASKDYYISIPSFLFIQIYDKKNEIISKLREQIIKDLNRDINFEKYLIDLYNKYQK